MFTSKGGGRGAVAEKFLSSASDEWSRSLPTSGQEFPHSPSPSPRSACPCPCPSNPSPSPLSTSGSSSEGGAVAVQNCEMFNVGGAVAHFDHIIFFVPRGAVDPWMHGNQAAESRKSGCLGGEN